MALQPSEVKQTVPDVHKVFVIKVLCGLFQHHAEEDGDGEENWCQDTSLFHPICDGEWLRQVLIQADLTKLILMQQDYQLKEFLGTTKSLQDHPEPLLSHSVKRLCQVYKGYVQALIFLSAFLLNLHEDKYYLCGAPVCSKATLAFWNIIYSDGWDQSV